MGTPPSRRVEQRLSEQPEKPGAGQGGGEQDSTRYQHPALAHAEDGDQRQVGDTMQLDQDSRLMNMIPQD